MGFTTRQAFVPTTQQLRDGKEIVRFSPDLDDTRRYLTDSMKPEDLASLLKDVDAGDLAAMVELNEEMEAKDAHLQGVANTRRESLTALDWSIEPDENAKDPEFAKHVAEFAQATLDGIDTWPTTLEHVASAIGPGIAIVELIWRRFDLVGTNDVPGHRLERFVNSDKIGIQLDHSDLVVAKAPKFATFMPKMRAGFPLRVTITRAQALLYLIKHFSIADWSAFSDAYGIPKPIAIVSENATPKEKLDIESFLSGMGGASWAKFSDALEDIKWITAQGESPHSKLIDWAERKQSILYLGQTLTTEMGSVGSFAAAKVHDNVRASILLSDIQNERRFIRNSILRPMVRFRYPTGDPPIPHFRRRVLEAANTDVERLWLEKFRFMQEANLPIDDDQVYESLGIRKPEISADVEADASARKPDVSATVNQLTLGIERANRAGNTALAKALSAELLKRLGTETMEDGDA